MNSNILELFKNIKLSNIVSTTNKTLSTVKKIIPVYKEVRPYINHEKSLFKKNNINNIKESNISNIDNNSYNDTLTFFH